MLVGQVALARQRYVECLALAVADGEELRAEAHVGLGWAALAQGHYGAAESHLDLALALGTGARPAGGQTRAAARMWRGELAARRGDHDTARRDYQAALAVAPAAQAPFPSARALLGLGRLALAQGDVAEAGRLMGTGFTVARQAADAYLVATSLEALGALAAAEGQRERARSLFGQAITLARRHRYRVIEAGVADHLGRLARHEGDLAAAARSHQAALALRAWMGDRAGVADSLELLGRVGVVSRHPGSGLCVMAAAHGLRQRLEHPRPAPDADGFRADLSAARDALGADFDDQWTTGVRLGFEEAVALAACAGFAGPTNRWDALSRAECRVVELVAGGLSNTEIAQRLGVSPATVQGHLRHVYAKLGLPTRAALVREVESR